ncbi:hypothetical protein CYY_001500 [Polysphondylium violaceum]|uniref:Rho-GAP domain-containing protein n=1 Tax=Polysphondylium violaceum TaxID=133409 RepID=A0A8J4Q1P9_9MYCE|nr:hypothetical protein CYY_001500 [Polysphondylium violaceum]
MATTMATSPVSLTSAEKKTIESILTQKREEGKLITKVSLLNEKKKKTESKTLILGINRLFLFSEKGKLSEDSHYLDIVEIQSSSEIELTIKFRNSNVLKMSNVEAGLVLKNLYSSYMSTFPGIKIGKSITFTVTPETRMVSIFQSTSFKDITGCGSFNLTYKSICDYLGTQPLSSVLWDIEYLYPFNGIKEFNIVEIYQYSPTDLKALLMSLAYNTYFTSINANQCKLSNEEVIQLSDVFSLNTSIQHLSLSHIQCSKEPIIQLLTSVTENKGLHLQSINLSQNILENKTMITLGQCLAACASPLTTLILDNTSVTGKGFESLFNSILANQVICTSLTYLSISNNKLEAVGSSSLCKFLSKSCVEQLYMSNTYPVFKELRTSSPTIQLLDFSGNKPSTTKEGWIDVLGFLKQMSHLITINLSKTQVGVDDLKLLFSPATGLLKCPNVDLGENDLGDQGIIKLCEIMYPNSNLRHLSIDGNFKTRSKFRMRAIDALINLVDDNCTVESLSIAAGSSKYQLKSDLMPLLLSLMKNQSLIKLDITGNGIGDQGALAISKVLWKNQTLKSLKCDGNDFSWTSLKMMKNGIKRNDKSVTFLPLPLSDISTILKTDNATLMQEKIAKTVVELSSCIVGNYKQIVNEGNGSSNNVLSPVKPIVIKKAASTNVNSLSTSNSSNSSSGSNGAPKGNSNPGYNTLPIKRPVRGPLYPGKTFNTPSTSASEKSSSNEVTIPPLVDRSIDLLIESGTKSVGIFRTCASATQLKKIKGRFEAGEDVDLKAENVDVDTVAGVLKGYFRELAVPIFPENLHDAFFQASRQPTKPDQMKSYSEIIDQLPPLESKMVKKLFLLLHLISVEKQENMMSSENIAICWAPTLFRSFASELLPINSFLIDHYYDIFDPENKPISPEATPQADSDSSVSNADIVVSSNNNKPANSGASTIGFATKPKSESFSSGIHSPLKSNTLGVMNGLKRNSNNLSLTSSNSGSGSSTSSSGSIGTNGGKRLSSSSINSSTSNNSNSSSSTNSSNSSPAPSPPDSPNIGDGTATLRSKRFSRVSRMSYSPVQGRKWTNDNRTVSSLFSQEDFNTEDIEGSSV